MMMLNFLFSVSSQDIQRRCESIVKMVEKEITDLWKVEEEEAKKVASEMLQNRASEGDTSRIPEAIQG